LIIAETASKVSQDRRVQEVVQRIYERENKIKNKLSTMRIAKRYEELQN